VVPRVRGTGREGERRGAPLDKKANPGRGGTRGLFHFLRIAFRRDVLPPLAGLWYPLRSLILKKLGIPWCAFRRVGSVESDQSHLMRPAAGRRRARRSLSTVPCARTGASTEGRPRYPPKRRTPCRRSATPWAATASSALSAPGAWDRSSARATTI